MLLFGLRFFCLPLLLFLSQLPGLEDPATVLKIVLPLFRLLNLGHLLHLLLLIFCHLLSNNWLWCLLLLFRSFTLSIGTVSSRCCCMLLQLFQHHPDNRGLVLGIELIPC